MKDLNQNEQKLLAKKVADANGGPNSDFAKEYKALQKIVSKIDEKGLQAFRFKVESVKENKKKIKLSGLLYYKKAENYVALLDVKAVPPHELKVENKDKKWTIKAMLDV